MDKKRAAWEAQLKIPLLLCNLINTLAYRNLLLECKPVTASPRHTGFLTLNKLPKHTELEHLQKQITEQHASKGHDLLSPALENHHIIVHKLSFFNRSSFSICLQLAPLGVIPEPCCIPVVTKQIFI